jgi:hypothetical protein
LPFEALTPRPHFSGADLNSVLSSLSLWATHELQTDCTFDIFAYKSLIYLDFWRA